MLIAWNTYLFIIIAVNLYCWIKYGASEALVVQKWLIISSLLGAFGIITQWIMFFPAWFLKDWRYNPFWWWLNDSRFSDRESGYAHDYEVYLNGIEENIWIAYKWHNRNPIWNLQELFKPNAQDVETGNQDVWVHEMPIDNLHHLYDIDVLKQHGPYEQWAGLKYWKNGISTWQTNSGSDISLDKSIVGEGLMFYWVDDKMYFRYSSCKVVRYFIFWKRWRTIKLGYNRYRYVRTLKYQKLQSWL
jgi:hypothetical protein